jgi:multidrug resistance efflux pump
MSKEAMKLALEAANKAMKDAIKCIEELGAKNKALEQALAEQHLQALHDENVRLGLYEQEKKLVGTVGDLFDEGVIWMRELDRDLLVYTATSQSKPLTDEQISDIAINNPPMVHEFARAIEAAHGIGDKT